MKFVVLAAALFAAIAEHKITDGLSRLGAFSYASASYEHIAVSPVLVIAVLLLSTIATISFKERGGAASATDWVVRVARRGETLSVPKTFASIFAMQIGSLFCMESVEQFLSVGHLEGGVSWLGAPIVAALAVAVTVASAVVMALRFGLAFIVSSARAVVAVCIELAISVASRVRLLVTFIGDASLMKPVIHILASRSGLRAPPAAL